MSSTIHCTFTGSDFADFAVGRLMQEVAGIQNIRHVKQKAKTAKNIPAASVTLSSWGSAENFAVASVSEKNSAAGQDPVTIKIICDSASKDRVISLLRTMQGYSIISAG